MIKHKINKTEEGNVISFLKDIIEQPSSAHDGRGIYDFVYQYMKKEGIDPAFQSIKNPYVTYGDYSNLYVKIGHGNGLKIMLNGHLDTVVPITGWIQDPYCGRDEDGKIYGIGSADMKGGCAAALQAAISLSRRKKVINGELFLTFVFGEEDPFSLGADTLLREFDLKDYDLIIVPEPSPLLAVNDYCYTHKKIHQSKFPVPIVGAEGRIFFEIEFFGKPAHASHPSQGINALEDAARLISQLTQFEMFENLKMGRGHYCVLNIDGGDQTFTVPSLCKVYVNRQLTLGETEKTATNELKKIIKRLKLRSKVQIKKRFSPDPILEYRPYLFEKSDLIDEFIQYLPAMYRNKRCRFTTSSVGDFNVFATRTGVPTLVFGPGGGNIHAPNEYVNKQDVIDTTNYLLNFFMEVF